MKDDTKAIVYDAIVVYKCLTLVDVNRLLRRYPAGEHEKAACISSLPESKLKAAAADSPFNISGRWSSSIHSPPPPYALRPTP
jgi:hypothetical protein